MNIDAAVRVLRDAGHAEAADWVGRLGMSPSGFLRWLAERGLPLRFEPEPGPEPEEPARSAVAAMLLDDDDAAPSFRLRIDGRLLRGPRGRVRLSPALRLLLRALQAPGEWVAHEYTPQSGERLLRAARSDLGYIAPELAERVATPLVEPGRVRVGYRDPTRLIVRDAGGIN